jgi:hypothetical protein
MAIKEPAGKARASLVLRFSENADTRAATPLPRLSIHLKINIKDFAEGEMVAGVGFEPTTSGL